MSSKTEVFNGRHDPLKVRFRDERILWLSLKCLSEGGITKAAYERTFGDVGPRTFYRDLEHLRSAGDRFGLQIAHKAQNGVFRSHLEAIGSEKNRLERLAQLLVCHTSDKAMR